MFGKYFASFTVGTREEKDVYSDLIECVTDDRQRYSVGLLWKTGQK